MVTEPFEEASRSSRSDRVCQAIYFKSRNTSIPEEYRDVHFLETKYSTTVIDKSFEHKKAWKGFLRCYVVVCAYHYAVIGCYQLNITSTVCDIY